MKSHRKELWFNTPARVAFVNITPPAQAGIGKNPRRVASAIASAGESVRSNVIVDRDPQ